jgi:hypothetical protein
MLHRHELLILVALAAPIAAQGHLRWPDPQRQVTAVVVQVAPTRYQVFVEGFTTQPTATDDDSYEAAGIGGVTSPTVIVNVPVAKLIDPAGSVGEDTDLFPFVPDPRVSASLSGLGGVTWWFGFLARVSQPVPAARPGTLAFELESFLPRAFVVNDLLSNAKIAVAEADANGALTGLRQYVLGRVQSVDDGLLYYKFDRGSGSLALNHAGFDGAPRNGRIFTNAANGFTPGWSASALRGSTPGGEQGYCDTGWRGSLHGSMTIAWAMRERAPQGPTQPRLFGRGAFSCAMNAQGQLRCSGWGGPEILTTLANVRGRAASTWVHVALVIDDSARATFWIDGVPEPAIPIRLPASLSASAEGFAIGRLDATADPSNYDIDDFRLGNAAADPVVIGRWSRAPTATALAFGRSCGAALWSNGRPTLGGTVQLGVEGPPGASFALALGVTQSLGGMALPIDLGLVFPTLAGCPWFSDIADSLGGTLGQDGLARRSLTIPQNPSLAGASLYTQVLAVDRAGAVAASNAHVLSVHQ